MDCSLRLLMFFNDWLLILMAIQFPDTPTNYYNYLFFYFLHIFSLYEILYINLNLIFDISNVHKICLFNEFLIKIVMINIIPWFWIYLFLLLSLLKGDHSCCCYFMNVSVLLLTLFFVLVIIYYQKVAATIFASDVKPWGFRAASVIATPYCFWQNSLGSPIVP